MNAAQQFLRVTDSTLRDGSHAVSHAFTVDQVRSIVSALDRAGVPVIEVSHGDGLGGSSFNYGFSTVKERELLQAASEAAKSASLAALLLPGIGVAEDLELIAELGFRIVRIATHCTEADIAKQHIARAKELGLEVNGFLMMAHMRPPAQLLEQARVMEAAGADCVYVVDSAGAMTMRDVVARVEHLCAHLAVAVGFHAHNNLSLALANTLASIEAGATRVDGCIAGLGAGAGNCPTEVLAAVCERLAVPTGLDTFALIDLAADVVGPLSVPYRSVSRSGLILGYAGVYGSFLLHAERAAERFHLDVKDILIELGRREMVGGQEDMIIDVAVQLASRNKEARIGDTVLTVQSESPGYSAGVDISEEGECERGVPAPAH